MCIILPLFLLKDLGKFPFPKVGRSVAVLPSETFEPETNLYSVGWLWPELGRALTMVSVSMFKIPVYLLRGLFRLPGIVDCIVF